MSIASAILALSPTAYWPLDELAGPTLFDNSGNGHNTAPLGSPTYGVQGPEAGTTAILFSAGGGLSITQPWGANQNAWSVTAYVALSTVSPTDATTILGGGGPVARGSSIITHTNWTFSPSLNYGHGTLPSGPPVGTLNQAVAFHHFGLTFSWTSLTNFNVTLFVDGASVASWGYATGYSWDGRLLVADTVWCSPYYASVVAHVAAFPVALNAGQMASIAGQSQNWTAMQLAPPSVGLDPGNTTVTDIMTALADILASVRKTY